MLNSFMSSLIRLFDQTHEPPEGTGINYSDNQLLAWAQGCMLEGLPDSFYEARLDCERKLVADGRTEISALHTFRLTSASAPDRFSPADALYPMQCIERVLKDKNWRKASLVFSPEKASFSWE